MIGVTGGASWLGFPGPGGLMVTLCRFLSSFSSRSRRTRVPVFSLSFFLVKRRTWANVGSSESLLFPPRLGRVSTRHTERVGPSGTQPLVPDIGRSLVAGRCKERVSLHTFLAMVTGRSSVAGRCKEKVSLHIFLATVTGSLVLARLQICPTLFVAPRSCSVGVVLALLLVMVVVLLRRWLVVLVPLHSPGAVLLGPCLPRWARWSVFGITSELSLCVTPHPGTLGLL